MNKVLPNQPSGASPVSRAQPRQHEDFSRTLRAKSREKSGPPSSRSGHGPAAGTPSSAPSPQAALVRGEKAVPGGARNGTTAPAGAAASMGAAGVDAVSGQAPDALLTREGAFASPVGLLAERLAWSRVYPEHLIGSGYLSVVDTATRGKDAPPELEASMALDAEVYQPDSNTGAPSLDLKPGAEEIVATFPLDPLQTILGTEGAVGSDGSQDAALSRPATGSAMLADRFWAERLLRLTQDGGGRNTVWLRDYGLKAADFEPVAASLRQSARQDGVLVGRIVINGREIWRAATLKGER